MAHQSQGHSHHADSTAECPDCGRRFYTYTSVTALPGGTVSVKFRSKQRAGQWGEIVVHAAQIQWTDKHPMANETGDTPAPKGHMCSADCGHGTTVHRELGCVAPNCDCPAPFGRIKPGDPPPTSKGK